MEISLKHRKVYCNKCSRASVLHRKNAVLLIVLFVLAPVNWLQAESSSSPDIRLDALATAASVCQLAGGIVTAGFGAWHYIIPDMYGWWPYLEDDPSELKRAVHATNFFFSTAMVIMGGANIALSIMPSDPFNVVWLWGMAGLWTARAIYQAVDPQGAHIPMVATGMLISFIAVDAAFIFSAIVTQLIE